MVKYLVMMILRKKKHKSVIEPNCCAKGTKQMSVWSWYFLLAGMKSVLYHKYKSSEKKSRYTTLLDHFLIFKYFVVE